MTDPLLTLLGIRIAAIALVGLVVLELPASRRDVTCLVGARSVSDLSAAPATDDAELRDMRLRD